MKIFNKSSFLPFLLFVGVFLHFPNVGKTAYVDSLDILSRSMNKKFRVAVILPGFPKQRKSDNIPVVILLHGSNGNHLSWLEYAPVLMYMVDRFKMAFVLPNVDQSSWYMDSPLNTQSKFENYITKELLVGIENYYPVGGNPGMRGISGFGMGGYGALSVALNNPGVFGIAGSTGGLMDFTATMRGIEGKETSVLSSAENNALSKQLGPYEKNTDLWRSKTIMGKMGAQDTIPKTKILFDCGTEDPYLEGNRRLHRLMTDKKFPHRYIESIGKGSAQYYSDAIRIQVYLFHDFFEGFDKI
jgi:S-formylglutathione hydrolase FrmB